MQKLDVLNLLVANRNISGFVGNLVCGSFSCPDTRPDSSSDSELASTVHLVAKAVLFALILLFGYAASAQTENSTPTKQATTPSTAPSAQPGKSAAPPIDLSADQVLLREEGEQVFTGNVHLRQGELSVKAEQIKIRLRNGAIAHLSAVGEPLFYDNRLPEGGEIHIEADSMEYVTAKWTLVLEGKVVLQRPGMNLSAQRAEYNLRKRRYVFTGSSTDSVEIRFSSLADKTF